MNPVEALPAQWRADAVRLREYADEKGAHIAEMYAKQLEDALSALANEPLTRTEAAAVAGCHPDSLTRRSRKGTLENIGSKHAPRFRRGDISPARPANLARGAAGAQIVGTTREQIARSVVKKGRDDG